MLLQSSLEIHSNHENQISEQWEPILEGELYCKANSILERITNTIQSKTEENSNINLIVGKTGQLLYLSHAGVELDNDLKTLFDYIGRNKSLDGSLMKGLSGIGFVVKMILDRCNSDTEDILDAFFRHVRKFAVIDIKRGVFDYMYGYMGQCYFLLQDKKSQENLELLKEATRVLRLQSIEHDRGIGWINHWEVNLFFKDIDLTSLRNCSNLGMSHGVPGIVSILIQIQAKYPELELNSLINDALECLLMEESEINRMQSGYYYPVYSGLLGKTHKGQLSWCYSDMGICMMYYKLWQMTRDAKFKEKADKIALSCSEKRLEQIPSMCSGLCHGASGIAFMFNKIYQITRNDHFRDVSLYWYCQLFDEYLRLQGSDQIQSLDYDKDTKRLKISNDMGFLEGLSGIGLAVHAAVSKEMPKWDQLLLL